MRRARVVRFGVVVTLVALVVGAFLPASAATYQDNPYKTAGTVDAVGDPVPALGVTASFRLSGLYNTAGASIEDAKDAQGRVTIYTTANTSFLRQTPNGNYRTASFEEVVVTGENVLVAGRWYVLDGRKTLFANYVWNPPPVAPGTRPPNPQPNLPRDAVIQRLFGVIAIITEQGVALVGSEGWSSAWGFTVGDISSYGSTHVQRIALHHDNKLRIYYGANTRYWTEEGTTTLDRSSVIKPQRVVRVTGRYSWDGTDWRFIASNVFANPAPSQGGPLSTTADLAQQSPGTHEPASATWTTSEYQGRSTGDFDGPTQASLSMTLDWVYDATSGSWEFTGVYTAQKDNSPNSIAGSITGVVTTVDGVQRAEALMSVDEAHGAWEGWTGDGSFEGYAQSVPPPSPSEPPLNLVGSFRWRLLRP